MNLANPGGIGRDQRSQPLKEREVQGTESGLRVGVSLRSELVSNVWPRSGSLRVQIWDQHRAMARLSLCWELGITRGRLTTSGSKRGLHINDEWQGKLAQ